MKIRIRPILGIALFAVAVGVAGFMMYLTATTDVDTDPVYVVPLLLGAAVGLVLSVRAPINNVGVVVSIATLGLGLLGLTNVASEWASERGDETLAVIAALVGDATWIGLFVPVLVLLPIWFPDGRAIAWWSKWSARLAIGASVIVVGAFLTAKDVCVRWAEGDGGCLQFADNPWGLAANDAAWAEPILFVPLAMILPALASVVLRRRRASETERKQLRWFGFAYVLMVVGFVLSFDVFGVPSWIRDTLSALSLSGVWLSIGVAVLRYRLYEIDRIISRTLSYVIVVLLLGTIYAFGAIWIPTMLVSEQTPAVFVAASTLAAAALFNPVRQRVHRWVDRRFNRARYDAERVMEELITRLRDETDPETVLHGWIGAVAETMQPASIGVWSRE